MVSESMNVEISDVDKEKRKNKKEKFYKIVMVASLLLAIIFMIYFVVSNHQASIDPCGTCEKVTTMKCIDYNALIGGLK